MPASDLPTLPASRIAFFIEGIDGAGKTELCLRLSRRIRYGFADGNRRWSAYGWPLDASLRRAPPAEPIARAQAHLSDFMEHLRLGSARSRGVQVHDRGPWSTIACQDPPQRLRLDLAHLVDQPYVVVVLLDLPPEVAAARRARRGPDPEADGRDLHGERQRYLALARSHRCAIVLDAARPAEEVEVMAWEGILSLWEAMSAAPARS
jgi:thymidylate kinase